MKNPLFITILAVAALLAIVDVYYIVVVSNAKRKTPELIEHYMSDEVSKIKYADLTDRQIEILLAVQDPGFWDHKGVDFATPGTGWTTITQSICKKFYFKNFKQGLPKIKQTLLARFVLNRFASKEEQIQIFMNIMWFDDGIVGFADASEYFYEKFFNELTEDEYISLVAMLNLPRQYNIKSNPEANSMRVHRIKKVLSGEYTPKGLFDTEYIETE